MLGRYRKVLVPEMNLGQLALLLRAEFLVDAVSYTKVRGRPLTAAELEDAIVALEGERRDAVHRGRDEGRTRARRARGAHDRDRRGRPAERLARALAHAADEPARQLLLARATGNYKRGNER